MVGSLGLACRVANEAIAAVQVCDAEKRKFVAAHGACKRRRDVAVAELEAAERALVFADEIQRSLEADVAAAIFGAQEAVANMSGAESVSPALGLGGGGHVAVPASVSNDGGVEVRGG